MKRLIFAALAFTASCQVAAAGFVPASDAFDMFLTSQNGTAAIVVDVMPGFALYRDKFLVSGEGTPISNIAIPRGEIVIDPELGASELLTGRVVVTFRVSEAPKPGSKIQLRYMGCKRDDYCYPPQSATFNLVRQ